MAQPPLRYIKRSHDEIGETVRKGRFQFAIECLREIERNKRSHNFVFSPSSIYEAVLLVYFASTHDVEDGLKQILHLSDVGKNDLKDIYINEKPSQLQEGSSSDKNKNVFYQTYSYNKCWITSTKLVKNTVRKDLFKNRLEILNFNEFANESIGYINETLREMMANYIQNPVKFNEIFRGVDFILLTFLDLQNEKLGEASTSLERKTSLTINPDMYMTEISYKNQSLFLLSPIAYSRSNSNWEINNDIITLVEQLVANIDQFRSYLDKGAMQMEMEVTYPEHFKIETDFPINTLFQNLNIQTLLESYPHQLSDFIERGSLSLGNGMHRACMETTLSEDVKVGAVTVLCTDNEGSFAQLEDIDRCESEHSFLWLIYDKNSHTIISMGAVNKNMEPANSE